MGIREEVLTSEGAICIPGVWAWLWAWLWTWTWPRLRVDISSISQWPVLRKLWVEAAT